MAKKSSKIGTVLLVGALVLVALGAGAKLFKKNDVAAEKPTVLTVSVQAGETLTFTEGSIEGVSSIHWGDGFVNQETAHTYTEAGTYRIKLYDVETLGNGADRLYDSSRSAALGICYEIEADNTLFINDVSWIVEGMCIDFTDDENNVIEDVANREVLEVNRETRRVKVGGSDLTDLMPAGGEVYLHGINDSWTLGLLKIEFGSEVENVAKSALDDYYMLTGYGVSK